MKLHSSCFCMGLLASLLSACSGGMGSDASQQGPKGGASTIHAATCGQIDVGNAISSAAGGGIVRVPAGSCSWGSTLSITRGVTLIGAGIGQTVITNISGGDDSTPLISYIPTDPTANALFELSGFTFDGNNSAAILFLSSGDLTTKITNIKVHDNKFQNAHSRAVWMAGLEFGVFYKNQYLDNYIAISSEGVEQAGWDYPLTPGGPNYPYFEDETFVQMTSLGGFISETGQGGRLVIRHSTVTGYGGNGGEIFDQHGVNGDFATGGRGTVASEFYNNTVSTIVPTRIVNQRGGKSIVFNITVAGTGDYMTMTEYQGWSYCQSTQWPAPNQIYDSYYWNNTVTPVLEFPSGGNCDPYNDSFFIQLNRDYWFPTAGLDASRPPTCTVGDKYGATDTGKLYSCDTTNVWTLQYAPYTYPHPLRLS